MPNIAKEIMNILKKNTKINGMHNRHNITKGTRLKRSK